MFSFIETHCFAAIHNKKTNNENFILYNQKIIDKLQRLPTRNLFLRSAAIFFGAVRPFPFPELRRPGICTLIVFNYKEKKVNTYTANGMEKKRNQVTQNTAVTAHFEGHRVDCQLVTDV